MASPIPSWMSEVTTLWEALTPPSRTTVPYREIDGKSEMAGSSGHRKFFWGPPSRGASTLESSSSSLVEWTIPCTLRLSTSGLNRVEWSDATANETNLLVRAVEKNDSWVASIQEVIGEPTSTDVEEESEDILVTITWRVTAWETD